MYNTDGTVSNIDTHISSLVECCGENTSVLEDVSNTLTNIDDGVESLVACCENSTSLVSEINDKLDDLTITVTVETGDVSVTVTVDLSDLIEPLESIDGTTTEILEKVCDIRDIEYHESHCPTFISAADIPRWFKISHIFWLVFISGRNIMVLRFSQYCLICSAI